VAPATYTASRGLAHMTPLLTRSSIEQVAGSDLWSNETVRLFNNDSNDFPGTRTQTFNYVQCPPVPIALD
jgi:hypothetical protein